MSPDLGAFDPTILLLVIPLVVLYVGLLVLAIADLLRSDRQVRGGSKPMWAIIIVFVNLFGPILYFLMGRVDAPVEPVEPGRDTMPGWGSPHDPPLVVDAPAGAAASTTPDAMPEAPSHPYPSRGSRARLQQKLLHPRVNRMPSASPV